MHTYSILYRKSWYSFLIYFSVPEIWFVLYQYFPRAGLESPAVGCDRAAMRRMASGERVVRWFQLTKLTRWSLLAVPKGFLKHAIKFSSEMIYENTELL